ncbi:hypothetical protein [Maribacter thermophilus]|uniref:hypothetical protein n=1 Tax=Maribacter thermophilus TaxID=1197874 RepID=UPI000640DB8A|nr:hypothetical protein [Maribacter thermophilus]
MKDGRLKNSITYLFIALLLSLKIAGLHVLSHSDDNEHALHCAICDHALAHDMTPALAPDTQDFKIENTEPVVEVELTDNYSFVISNTIASDQLFSRPPPFVL